MHRVNILTLKMRENQFFKPIIDEMRDDRVCKNGNFEVDAVFEC